MICEVHFIDDTFIYVKMSAKDFMDKYCDVGKYVKVICKNTKEPVYVIKRNVKYVCDEDAGEVY